MSRFQKFAADGTQLPDDNTDHVAVIDTTTGLMWAVVSLGSTSNPGTGITQPECIERCSNLDLAGHRDWDLPTRGELASLVDDTRFNPAIDTAAFPGVKPRWHWTKTDVAWETEEERKAAGLSAFAWSVDFLNGVVYAGPRYDRGVALAVRRVGQ